MIRLGISSYTYGWAVAERRLDALALIDRAVAFNVRVLQICDNLPADTYEDASVARIAAYAKQKQIDIELGTRGCAPEHLRTFIRHATMLGSPVLRVVLDGANDHPSVEEVITRLGVIKADLDRAGVTLCIENHDRFKAAQLAHVVRELDSRHVAICLDTVNSMGALEGPEIVVDTLGPLVANLHLKDFAVERVPYLQGFTIEGRPAGEGMLDVPWLLQRLAEFGKTSLSAIAELWVPPESTTDATIEKESQWASRSVAHLRKWITN